MRHPTKRPNHQTHGMYQHPLYAVWQNLKGRCYNKNNKEYPNYGARGIRVCARWMIFENFRDDMLDGFISHRRLHPGPRQTQLDRIDVNGNYAPSNCRWVTPDIQANNTRKNHFIKYKGVEKTISEWADDLHIPYNTLHNRLTVLGWSINRAFTIPSKLGNNQFRVC